MDKFHLLRRRQLTDKILILITCAVLITTLQSCSNFGAGFGSYEKPTRTSNKYYNRKFQITNSNLKIAVQYTDFENLGLDAQNKEVYSYFVFFDNGFVLHNSQYKIGTNDKRATTLKYNDIYAEDIGSYSVNGDTIFWGTRPGYIRRKKTRYYSGIITDSGIHVLSSPFPEIKFFRLNQIER